MDKKLGCAVSAKSQMAMLATLYDNLRVIKETRDLARREVARTSVPYRDLTRAMKATRGLLTRIERELGVA